MASGPTSTTVTKSIKYEPFSDAQEFSDLMPELFNLYLSYRPDTFSFDFLQRTPDLKVVCKDTTTEKIAFVTPLALENAIQNSARINFPDDSENPWGPPVDDSWTGWVGITIDTLIKGVDISRGEQEFDGPLFSVLGEGLVVNSHRRVLGHRLFRHRPDHWTFMIRDHSPLSSKGKNGKNYLVRSEIMGITSIIYHQMNKVRWDPSKHEYMQPQLTYQGGPLTATIVTFMVGKVRVVQATCDPSNQYPTLTFVDATKTEGIKNGAAKFTEFVVEGSRIIPSRNKDHNTPLRVDTGKYDPVTKLLNVVLQVNSKPQSKGLQDWLKKFSSHAKLATAKFNTVASDKQAEYHRVLGELATKGEQNLKDMKTADDESNSELEQDCQGETLG